MNENRNKQNKNRKTIKNQKDFLVTYAYQKFVINKQMLINKSIFDEHDNAYQKFDQVFTQLKRTRRQP